MASSTARKQCANENGCKQLAAAVCEGCSQALCTKHFTDHREFLGEKMNEIISEHDQFQHTLNQQTTSLESPSPIKEIDEWEKESIAKIQKKANELRQELHQHTKIHLDDLSKKVQHLSEKLKEGRAINNFVETDLRDWKKTLDDLKEYVAPPLTFSISQHDGTPLVQDVFVNLFGRNELFERVFDNAVRIEENGHVALRNATRAYTEVRGKNEYTSGSHEIRLRIEQTTDNPMFLGINSKVTPLQSQSWTSKSAYGWTNNNILWLNGKNQANTSTPRIEMKKDDIISLVLDCENRKISMINQRTNGKSELGVNTDVCPFPWQLHVNLFEANSSVRILSA